MTRRDLLLERKDGSTYEIKDRYIYQWSITQNSEKSPQIYSQVSFDKDVKTIQRGRMVSSTNGAGIAGYAQILKNEVGPLLPLCKKLITQMHQRPK